MQKNKRVSDHMSSLRKVRTTTTTNKECGTKRKRITRKGYLFMMEDSIRIRDELEAAFVEKFGNNLPVRDVSIPKFEEQQFGNVREPGQDNWCQLSKTEASRLSDRVVSIALFDGDKMLFACAGIILPRGTSRLELTRFLTSKHLITVFELMRNKEDKLRVAVRLPDKRIIPGILGLYDDYIAIVTSLGFQSVSYVDMYQKADVPDVQMMVAAGRAYTSCSLMGAIGAQTDAPVEDRYKDLSASTCQITEAGLGGPLLDPAGNFVGVNICIHDDKKKGQKALFLPRMLLRQRLEKYEILTPGKRFGGIITPCRPGLVMAKNTSLGSYVPPGGASRIIPSGFLDTWNWLQSMGYPEPPPLMLELNGRLVRKYEEVFGCLLPWKGYKLGIPYTTEKNAWLRLDKKIILAISRRVVSLVSFRNARRFFSCTGFIVRFRLKNGRTRNVIVTSASLVRTCDATDTIENMRIEVFLPPNQRLNGTLESYHSGYNIAIVTVKGLRNVCPVDFQGPVDMHLHPEYYFPRTVVAIGREPGGVLCASMGEPIPPANSLDKPMPPANGLDKPIPPANGLDKPITFGCEDIKLSTCKIKTVGTGGPLINLRTGCLLGMNFYDGRPGRTPYLPYHQICEVLSYGQETAVRNHTVLRLDRSDEKNKNRWPVPKPYWYHGLLEVDRFDAIPMRGRILD